MMEEEDLKEEINTQDLALAADIAKTLTKTIRTFNVYPRDNPIYQRFANDLFDKFNRFFESVDELTFDVEQHSLLFKGTQVFHSEERSENIALLLFADGIRQISFYKGITSEEIIDFIDILRIAPKAEVNDEDDIVTLLWEKNIRNMGYASVEDTVDDDLAVEAALLESLDQERTADSFIDSEASGNKSSPEISLPASRPPPSMEPLNADELILVKNELDEALKEETLLSSAVSLFFELLENEHDAESFTDIIHHLGKLVDRRMQQGDVAGTIEILAGVNNVSERYGEPDQREVLSSFSSRAGSLDKLRILFCGTYPHREIRDYLFHLGDSVVPNLIQILGDLQDRKLRRFLCDVLADLGRKNVRFFFESLSDERWYLVRNLVMILGMIGDPVTVEYLRTVLHHSDPRVRREALRALEGIQTAETKKIFLNALSDTDLSVRIIALKSLKRFRDPEIFSIIRKAASFDELKKRPLVEKKEILEALALLGGDEAFGVLSELFRKRGLLEKDEITEIRASAAYGLGLVASPEALSLLEKETGSRKTILREACVKALKESKKSGSAAR
jgi:hypothetical protein